jgi:hypothetical protein
MTRNGVTTVNTGTQDAGAVIEAGRRRLRLLLITALLALAVTGIALVATTTPDRTEQAAPVCLVFGLGPVNNGKAVIAAGLAMGVPEQGIVTGLTAAMQETELRNLANPNVSDSLAAAHDGLAVDHQAVGILQQGATWGSAEERMAPAVAAEKFYTAMRSVDGWEQMAPAELAALVQRSAWPDGYLDEVAPAREFYRSYIGEVQVAHCSAGGAADAALVGAGS